MLIAGNSPVSSVQLRPPEIFTLLSALGATLVAAPRSVRAQEVTPDIEYAATSDCPDASAFRSLVRAHAGERWAAHPKHPAPRFVVDIEDGAAGAIGRLRRVDAGSSATREVTGARCQEVAEALALTAALSLAEAPPPAPPMVVSASDAAVRKPAEAGATPHEWTLGAGLGAWGMLTPRPIPAGALSAGYRARAERSGLHAGLLELRISAFHARNHPLGDPEKAEFQLSGAGLDLCPLGAGGPRLDVRLCATGQLGALSGSGVDVAQPRAVESLWAAGGLLARAGLRLGTRFVLQLDAGAVVPARRTEFVFERPRVAVATVPRVIPQLGLTAAMTIP
jgi:hypothetical protein